MNWRAFQANHPEWCLEWSRMRTEWVLPPTGIPGNRLKRMNKRQHSKEEWQNFPELKRDTSLQTEEAHKILSKINKKYHLIFL